MRRELVQLLCALLAAAALAACRPEPLAVEVTRLVTVVSPGAAVAEEPPAPQPDVTAVTDEPATVAPPTPQVITATVEVTRPPLGTAERPVQLVFPPLADASVITQRGQGLADALSAATGLEFVVGIADNEAALVDLLCDAPADTVAVLSAPAYVVAHDRCDVQVGLVARHDDDLTWESGMLVTRAGSGLNELAALDDKRWAVAKPGDLATSLFFRAALAEAGAEPAEVASYPEDSSALLALVNEDVDFTTAVYTPPVMPLEREWTYGETDPEEWRVLGISPTRSPIGYVLVAGEPEAGGYRLRDARARLFDTNNAIFDQTRILAVSPPIPNETVVLGAEVPLTVARAVLGALPSFVASEACEISVCSADFTNWTGLEPVDESAYDPIRTVIDQLDLEPADLWAAVQ